MHFKNPFVIEEAIRGNAFSIRLKAILSKP